MTDAPRQGGSIFTPFGGRRFVMIMGCAVVATVLVWFDKLSGGEFVTLISLTVTVYVGGNTTQKVLREH